MSKETSGCKEASGGEELLRAKETPPAPSRGLQPARCHEWSRPVSVLATPRRLKPAAQMVVRWVKHDTRALSCLVRIHTHKGHSTAGN